MGSQFFRPADQQHFLDEADEETVPLFEKIKIVLIGYCGAGKNTVGNTILRKKAFTRWNTHPGHFLKADNTIFGRRVSLIRVPGWSGDLSSEDIKQMKLRQVIKDSVKSFKHGPHVIILVVKMNSKLTMSTKGTLEKLLSDNLSKHTLVFSIDEDKVSFVEMKDHCQTNQQTVITMCRNRYQLSQRCKCGKQNMELIEAIEDFIARKDPIHFYPLGNEASSPELQVEHLATLVNRLTQRIQVLSESISKLQSDNQMDSHEIKTKIDFKNEKIRKLQHVIREKESVIERLKPHLGTTVSSVLQEEETQSEDEATHRKKPQRKTWKKKKELKKKNMNEEPPTYRCHLEGINKPKMQTNTKLKKNLQEIISDDEGLDVSEPYKDSTSNDEGPHSSESYQGAKFVDLHSADLIQRVVSVDSILDELAPLIGRDKYSKIRAAQTTQNKMRELYIILNGSGQKLKEEFYKSLIKHENYLLEDLRL